MGLISTTDNCYRNIRDLSVITLLFVLKDIIHVSLLWNYSPWIWIQAKTELIIILVTQSCLTLCNSMDCSLPGFSIHGIFRARILEWVAISFSREFSRPRDQTLVSRISGRVFTVSARRCLKTTNRKNCHHHSTLLSEKDVFFYIFRPFYPPWNFCSFLKCVLYTHIQV